MANSLSQRMLSLMGGGELTLQAGLGGSSKVTHEKRTPVAHGRGVVGVEQMLADDAVVHLPDFAAPLTRYARDHIALLVPMRPLCGSACKGLCHVCGISLNENECGCDRSSNDPRLAALKKIKFD